MENNATQDLEKTPKWVEDFAQVPPVAWPVLAVFLMVVGGTIPVWTGVIAVVGILIAKHFIEKEQALKEAKARAAVYANICGPVVVSSLSPEETPGDVAERARLWREQLRLSGNPYAEKIPIIVLPFQPMLYPDYQLSIGWNIYQKEVAGRQHTENMKWYEGGCPGPLKITFASAVLPAPKIEEI